MKIQNLFRGFKRPMTSLTPSEAERRHALVGPAELWKMKRDFQIQFLKKSNLQPHHYLLDIGCGTLRGGIPLIDYLAAGHYFGIEPRQEVLDEGRRELLEAGLAGKNPTLLFSPDISQLDLSQKFDFAWAFSVLFHMTDDILNNTLNFVSHHLSDGGVFYGNVNIGKGKTGHWQGFPEVWRTFAFYSDACCKNGLTVSDVGTLKNLGHVTNVKTQDQQVMLKISKK